MEAGDKPEPAGAPAPAIQPVGAGREIELKLLVAPGALDALANMPMVLQNARNRGMVRRFENAYFDTPDRQLFRNGIALRVRRSGKTFIQTLKRPAEEGMPFARHEWEVAVPDFAPHLDLLPLEALAVGMDGVTDAVLEAAFVTRFRRRSQYLDLPSACVEFACDEGEIEAGGKREKISEVEIELKSGDPAALYDLALTMLDNSPLRVSTRAKADRGYQLAYATPVEGMRASKSSIRPDDNIDEVVAKLLGDCYRHMIANQAVAEDGTRPEGVHQMRVALRRMRTAISILQRRIGSPTLAIVGQEAKWLASSLGSLRNWDVLDVDTIAGIETRHGDAKAFEALRQGIAPHRAAGYETLRELFAGQRYNRFLLVVARAIERRSWRNDIASVSLNVLAASASNFARESLDRLHRRALKGGKHFRQLTPHARHELRLVLKKLRYTAEFFKNIFGDQEASQRYLARLAALQQSLGLANDAATTGGLLAVLTEEAGDIHLHRGAGIIAGWQARDELAEAGAMHGVWKRFAQGAPFWG